MLREFFRLANVFVLRTLVTAAKKHDQETASLGVIHPVSGAVVNLQLDDAFTDAARLARVAVCQPVQPIQDAETRLRVSQIGEPFLEDLGSKNLNHKAQLNLTLVQRLHPQQDQAPR
jgi:hypothetical protein